MEKINKINKIEIIFPKIKKDRKTINIKKKKISVEDNKLILPEITCKSSAKHQKIN